MSGIAKRVEIVANIAIIIVGMLLTIVLVRNYILPQRESSRPPQITVGSRISISGVDWIKNHRTLVLALQKDCHFCTESAPFYKRVVENAARSGKVRLVAVMPNNSKDAGSYLKRLDIPIEDVHQIPLDVIRVRGTPTLILVDHSGVVANVWFGKLDEGRELEVLSQL